VAVTEHSADSRWFRLLCLALAVGTLAIYSRVLHCDFTNFDDPDYVIENAHVRTGMSLRNLGWALTSSHSDNWHPLTWMSHMLDCQIYGLKPFGHHLTNLLFHAVNALLLFGLLRRMTGALWRSAIVAALFAWHPLRVESVAWISERKDVLSAFLGLLTIWAYLRFAEESKVKSPTPINRERASTVFYALALALFALGLMAKPMLVTLPFVLLLLDYWPLNRAPSFAPGLVLEKVPFLLLSAASCVVTFLVQQRGGAVVATRNLSILGRFENAVISYCRYLAKTFWPADLSVFYPRPAHWPIVIVILSAAVLLCVSGAVVMLRGKQPWLPVGWFWFLGTLVPVIGLVQVGDQSMADRYTYIPSIGLLIMLVWSVAGFVESRQGLQQAAIMASTAITLICGALTWVQISYWQDTETLFQHALAVTPNNYSATWHLADYYADHHAPADAMEMYRRTLETAPGCFQARNNLGKLLLAQGHLPEAMTQFQKVIELKPDHPRAHNNLGIALYRQGHTEEAMREFREALRLKADLAEAHNNLALALLRTGRPGEAIAEFQAGIALEPSDADAQFNLGTALEDQGRLDEAIARFRQAVQLQPSQADAHNSLGSALGRKGLSDEAIAEFQEAIRLDPNSAEAHCNLGIMLAAKGDRQAAIAQLNRALALQPNYPEAAQRLRSLTNAP
jgi:protein O-mannosyl-transferase